MDVIIGFSVWVVSMVGITVWLYKSTRFVYSIEQNVLRIRLLWAGLIPIDKKIPLSEIDSVYKLASLREIIPLVNGTFPSLWGKFRPSKMVVIKRKAFGIFPTMITPDDPDVFLQNILPLFQRTGSKVDVVNKSINVTGA